MTERSIAVGTPSIKPAGYPFPGEVRAAFTTIAGELRYVVEATGPGYAGMLHIFNPSQVAPVRGDGPYRDEHHPHLLPVAGER